MKVRCFVLLGSLLCASAVHSQGVPGAGQTNGLDPEHNGAYYQNLGITGATVQGDEKKKSSIKVANKLKKYLGYQCSGNKAAIFHIESTFSGGSNNDRVWKFGCRHAANTMFRNCWWSGYENGIGGKMNFTCPTNQVLLVVIGDYQTTISDRRFRYYCSGTPHYYTSKCYYSEWLNTGTERIYVDLHHGRYITGMASVFDYEVRDRAWKVRVCEYGNKTAVI